MRKKCPHCGGSIGAPGHERYGLEKIEKGWIELGIPVVGRASLRKEAIVMVGSVNFAGHTECVEL